MLGLLRKHKSVSQKHMSYWNGMIHRNSVATVRLKSSSKPYTVVHSHTTL